MSPARIAIPTVGIIALLCVALLVWIAVSGIVRLISDHNAPQRRSILRPVMKVFVGFVVVSVLLVLMTVPSYRHTVSTSEKRWNDAPASITVTRSATVRDADTMIGTPRLIGEANNFPATASQPQPLVSADADLQNQAAATGATTLAEPDMVWLPFSREDLAAMLGGEAVDDLTRLRDQLPANRVSRPVIRHVLSPTPVRQLLTPPAVEALAKAVAGYLAVATETDGSSDSETLPDLKLPADAFEHRLATWVHQTPNLGQMVVSGDWQKLEVSAQDALSGAIDAALDQRITELCKTEFGIGEEWKQLVDVSVSNGAIGDIVVKTSRERTEIESAVGGTIPMQKTYALVEFPALFEQRVMGAVRGQLTHTRTLMLATVLGALWLASVLIAIGSRAAQSGSFIGKLATVPAMILLVIPCFLLSVGMMAAMVNGETMDFPIGNVRITCTADGDR